MTKKAALIVVPFQVNSLLALAETKTKTTTATKNPILGSKRPYKITAPVIWAMMRHLNFGIASIVALAPKDLTRTNKPMATINMPSQNGK